MLQSIRNSNNKKYYDYFRVLREIYENAPVSKLRLLELTKLKYSTLARIVTWFLDNHIICVADNGESTGGRKPALYDVCSDAGYIIGIDIARMYTKVALMDFRCKVLKSEVFGMFEESVCNRTIDKICTLIDELKAGVDDSKILGIGIGIVGTIGKEKGIIANHANLSGPEWEFASVKEHFRERTGLPVFADNGVNTAALAEYRSLDMKNIRLLAYVTAGIGQRLGIIYNGKFLNNSGRVEGAFGHVTVEENGRHCYCGNSGCLEAYASIPSVMDICRKEIRNGRRSVLLKKADFDLSTMTFDMFCQAIDENDELANEIILNASEHFSTAIANMVKILNPEIVIFGGPFVQKCKKFLALTIESTRAKLRFSALSNTAFSAGNLADNAAVIGAGHLVLDHFLNFN